MQSKELQLTYMGNKILITVTNWMQSYSSLKHYFNS